MDWGEYFGWLFPGAVWMVPLWLARMVFGSGWISLEWKFSLVKHFKVQVLYKIPDIFRYNHPIHWNISAQLVIPQYIPRAMVKNYQKLTKNNTTYNLKNK